MKDVTEELLKGEDYKGEKKVNRLERLDILLNKFRLISENLDPSRTVYTVVKAGGVVQQVKKGTIQDAKALVEDYSATHTMELYVNQAQNRVIIVLGKKVNKPADKAG